MIYEKPIVLLQNDLAEGVYAASGAPVTSDSGATYTLAQTNAWDGNKQYNITFTNHSSEKVDSVTVMLNVHGNVTSIGGNVSGAVNGNTAVVTFSNYGNGIEGGATVGPIYMAVTGTGDFSLD